MQRSTVTNGSRLSAIPPQIRGCMNSKEVVVVSVKQSTIGSNRKQRRPTNEEIAARIYEVFVLHGASHGSDLGDWLRAEQELQELLERKRNRPQVRTTTDW